MEDVPIDRNARVDTNVLRDRLEDCLQNQKPVFAVVAIIGSTEEGCVDPLDEILDLRDEYEEKGLCFLVHADAAWGGYFASMVRDKPAKKAPVGMPAIPEPPREYVPTATLRESTVRQFLALARTDSITIDPHKAGYIPYPAGGLCYRDGRMRYLVTWSAPYIKQSDDGESIGIYGVEGRSVTIIHLFFRSIIMSSTASQALPPSPRISTIKSLACTRRGMAHCSAK